jgi:hypothetical protein
MKKTKNTQKLTLDTETLKNLTPAETDDVLGGANTGSPPELTRDRSEPNCSICRACIR